MAGTRAADTALADLLDTETPALVTVAAILLGDEPAAASLVERALVRAGSGDQSRTISRAAVAADVVVGCRRELQRSSGRRWTRSPEPALGLYDAPTADDSASDHSGKAAFDPVWEAFTDLPFELQALVALRCRAGFTDIEMLRALGGRVPWPRRALRRALDDVAATSGRSPDAVEQEVAAALRGREAAPSTVAATVAAVAASVRARPPGVPARRVRAGTAGALALLVTAGAGAAYLAADDSVEGPPLPRVGSPAAASAAPGHRLVGFGTVMLAVPRSWGYNRTACGSPTRNTVIFPDADPPSRCRARGDRRGRATTRWSSVTFTAAPSNALVLRQSTETDAIAGERVFSSPLTHRGGVWQQVVVVPGAGVQVVTRSPRRSVLSAVVGSLRAVPPGYGAVPVCVRQPIGQAIAAVKEAGLAVSFTQASTLSQRYRQPPVTHQTLQPGRVVPVATVVGLGFPSTDE